MLKKLAAALVFSAVFLLVILTIGIIKLLENQTAIKQSFAEFSYKIKNSVEKISNDTASNIDETSTDTKVIQNIPDQSAIDYEVTGTIKKEKIPANYQLGGDYWYVFYFDKPFLLESNSTGWGPIYINDIQLVTRDDEKRTDFLEKYVNKHVIIAGNLTWGYAESNTFRVVAITEVK